MSSEKRSQTSMAVDLAVEASAFLQRKDPDAAKVFGGLSDQRVKPSADSVFKQPSATQPRSVEVITKKSRVFKNLPRTRTPENF